MRRILLLSVILVSLSQGIKAQNAIYFPMQQRTVRPSAGQIKNPERFDVTISFDKGSDRYSLEAIDILDSVYRISFAEENPVFYRITITGYDDDMPVTDTNNHLTRNRVKAVYDYILGRCKTTDFPIRTSYNQYENTCSGTGLEKIRYKVPVDFKWVALHDKPQEEKLYNKTVPLSGKVLISFTPDLKGCIGDLNQCYVPNRDTIIRGPYSTVTLVKGCFESIFNTKSLCNTQIDFSIEEHLDFNKIVGSYFLVPSDKQVIVQCGFLVLKSNKAQKNGECKQPPADSIFLRIPATEDQLLGKVRFFAKEYSDKGVQYKAITTKKVKSRVTSAIQCALNATQIDTIFIGKRIMPEEAADYFYPAKENEPGAFKIKNEYYRAYKLDKKGEMTVKKPFEKLFRIQEEEVKTVDPLLDARDVEESSSDY